MLLLGDITEMPALLKNLSLLGINSRYRELRKISSSKRELYSESGGSGSGSDSDNEAFIAATWPLCSGQVVIAAG